LTSRRLGLQLNWHYPLRFWGAAFPSHSGCGRLPPSAALDFFAEAQELGLAA